MKFIFIILIIGVQGLERQLCRQQTALASLPLLCETRRSEARRDGLERRMTRLSRQILLVQTQDIAVPDYP